jgi:DNA-binding CsgD family transcriptional regulator
VIPSQALALADGDDSLDGGRQLAPPARVFVGRLSELNALAVALGQAQAGGPQVVLIEGEGGVGKSSLIFEFLGTHPEVPAVTASGEPAEAMLSYGVVQQLAASTNAALPRALTGLELLSCGPPANSDPLAVGVELLALISSLQEKHAVVVVIEDLQWADPPSARALLFACRRLASERVLVILSCRPEGTSQLGEGWARFVSGDRRASRSTLSGLNVEELGMLCQGLGRTGISERAVHRLAEYTGGNPLYARTLLAELPDAVLKSPHGIFRVPRSLAGLILPRLAALSEPARELVVGASVLGDHCTIADAATVAGIAEPTAALDEAERGGFLTEEITLSGPAISFLHLLIRQAIYDDLGPERRRRLHLRAAAIVGGAASLAHRTAAAIGPDPQLAADLSVAATAATAAGNLLLAAKYLQQAAAVTARGRDQDDFVLSAFEQMVRAADVAAATAARPVIEQLPASVRRDTVLGRLALLAARPLEAEALLRAAWDASDQAGQDAGGGEAALWLGQLLGISGSFTESGLWLDRALRSGSVDEPWYDGARCVRSIGLALNGDMSHALDLFGDLPSRAAMVPRARTDALSYRGIVRLWTGDLPPAVEDLAVAASRISAGLQVLFPSPPLGFLAEAEFRLGRWDDATGHADLAVSLACDADRDCDLAFVHSIAVPVPACRGDWAVAAGHLEAAEQAARTFPGFAPVVASARGILGLARDDPQEALRGAALALAVPKIDRYDDPAAFWWRPLQAWALIRTGDLGEAETIIAAFKSRAAERGQRDALILAAWLGGSLALARCDTQKADEALRAGRWASRDLALPFHRALLDLEHGRCLARMQRRGAAIDVLRAAHDVFSGLRAHPFIRASESELAVVGLRPRSDGDPDLPGLTAQELRVARLVASGMSNRETAARMYLSPKTVEYHLRHAFTKLGVHSRHQLATLVRGHDNLGIPT